MVVAFDVDDVLCDLFPVWVAKMNEMYGLNNPVDYWPIYNPWEQLGVTKEQALASLIPLLYHDSLPFDGALAAVEAVRAMGHRIVFLTTCPDMDHYGAKLLWLARHGFSRSDYEVIPIGDCFPYRNKGEYPTDYLVDDHVKNVEGRRGGILLNRPHNLAARFTGRRMDSLKEFATYLWALPAFSCDARAFADYQSVGGSDF